MSAHEGEDDDLVPDELRSKMLREWLQGFIGHLDKRAVDEMEQRIDEDHSPTLDDDQVVLFGAEGQIDGIWTVPEPRPTTLRKPIPLSIRQMMTDPDGSMTASIRIADYDRIGPSTYQRRP